MDSRIKSCEDFQLFNIEHGIVQVTLKYTGFCVKSNYINVVNYILKNNLINVHIENDILLRLAVYNNFSDMAMLLMDRYKANIFVFKYCIFEYILRNNNLELLKFVISVRDTENIIKDDLDFQKHVYQHAVLISSFEIIIYLIENVFTLSSEFYFQYSVTRLEVIEYLVKKRNSDFIASDSILPNAIRIGTMEVIKYLVNAGANTRTKAVEIALSNTTNTNILEYFLQFGLNVNNILHCATRFNNERVVKFVTTFQRFNPSDLKQFLIWFCGSGNLSITKHFIEHCGLKITDECVTVAFYRPNTELILYLLQNGGNKSIILAKSILINDFKIVKLLIEEHNMDVNTIYFDENLVTLAVKVNNMEILNYLLDKKGKVTPSVFTYASVEMFSKLISYFTFEELKNPKTLELIAYPRKKYLEFFKILFEYEPRLKTSEYSAILLKGIQYDKEAIIYLVKEAGADINNGGILENFCELETLNLEDLKYYISELGAVPTDELLESAVMSGNINMVKYLVENCDLSVENGLLFSVCELGNFEIAEYLISRGATVDNEQLMVVSQNKLTDMMRLLVKNGADPHADNGGALVLACGTADGYFSYDPEDDVLESVKYLVEECGVDIHSQDDEAIREACEADNLEIVEYLVEKGIDKSKITNEKFLRIIEMKDKVLHKKVKIIQDLWRQKRQRLF